MNRLGPFWFEASHSLDPISFPSWLKQVKIQNFLLWSLTMVRLWSAWFGYPGTLKKLCSSNLQFYHLATVHWLILENVSTCSHYSKKSKVQTCFSTNYSNSMEFQFWNYFTEKQANVAWFRENCRNMPASSNWPERYEIWWSHTSSQYRYRIKKSRT